MKKKYFTLEIVLLASVCFLFTLKEIIIEEHSMNLRYYLLITALAVNLAIAWIYYLKNRSKDKME
jgi:uncharacterized membrane protein